MNFIVDVISWVRVQMHMLNVLSIMIDRIEKLEQGMFHGHAVHTVHVPHGMSVEVAWRHHRDGVPVEFNGNERRRVHVLVDNKGNFLKTL